MCIPIVTLGYGCLSERVIHGKTGYITKNNNEFTKYTLELFKNDHLWQSMRNNLEKIRSKIKWNNVAEDLINQI